MSELDRISARSLASSIPLTALLEITGRCSLDCQHCYLDIRKPPPELSTEKIQDILVQLSEAGTLFLTISGGEVFLRCDLFEILESARSLGFAVRLFTSGTRLSEGDADRLAALSLVAVELSVYGATANVHDALTRRPGSFIKTIKAAKDLIARGQRVVLKAPILDTVAHEASEFLDLCEEIGAQGKLDPGITVRRDGNRAPVKTRPSAEALAKVLRDPRVYGVDTPLPPQARPDEAPCAVGRRTCRIGPEGLVYPCSTYPNPVGDLRSQSFAEIWWGTSELLARLRGIRTKDLGPVCSTCEKSGYCKRCLALALIEHGSETVPSEESCRIAEAHELAKGLASTTHNEGRGRPLKRLPILL